MSNANRTIDLAGTQILKAADGTAAAPSITNDGDTDTGMFFPAADTLAFSEGGTEVVRINSSGNVGVGTTTPSQKLEVNGSVKATSLVFSDSTSQSTSAYTGFRNRIINGDMRIDQRNAGASLTPTDQAYGIDRWKFYVSQASKYTAQQSTTSAIGFSNSLLITSLSSYAVGAGERFMFGQSIEGYNAADFGFGTANAKTITLSFWVRSSLTGTFGGSLGNVDSTRTYPFSYTISSANTWEQKSIIVAGDTSGTWNKTIDGGLWVYIGLGVGSTYSGTAGAWSGSTYFSATGATSVVGTSGATFYITGVQLEAGSTATDFERRPYGTELALCQRYYYRLKPNTANGYLVSLFSWTSNNLSYGGITFPVPMRAIPASLEQTGTASDYSIGFGQASGTCTAVPAYAPGTYAEVGFVQFTRSTGHTAGQAGYAFTTSGATPYLAWSAEL